MSRTGTRKIEAYLNGGFSMNSVPYSYGNIMLETAPVTPSTIHVTNTALSAFLDVIYFLIY